MTAFDIQLSACPAAAPEEDEVLESVADADPEELPLAEDEVPFAELEPLEDAEPVEVADPVEAVAPWLNEVREEAALQLPAVLAAQHAAFPEESVPQ